MKVLVIPSWYPPNGGRFFKYQAESLAKLGHDVDVLVLEEKGLTQRINTKIDASKSKWVNEIRYYYYRIPKLDQLNTKLYIKKYRRILLAYLKDNKPDVIHIHSAIWAGVVAKDIAVQFGIPYVITEHRSLFFESEWPFSAQLKLDTKQAFSNAQKVILVSKSMEAQLDFFVAPEKIAIIPNMIDLDVFKADKKIKKESVFTFLSVGTLIDKKGFDVLINAFYELKKTNKNIQLKIIGEGVNKSKLQQLVAKLQLSESVIFGGYKTKEELVVEYSKVHVFVSPSLKEPFGVVIIEALACGLPIVVTNSGGPANIVNQENGYLAEVGNANSLQEKMQLMINNLSNFDLSLIRTQVQNTYSDEVVSKALEKQLKNVSKSN